MSGPQIFLVIARSIADARITVEDRAAGVSLDGPDVLDDVGALVEHLRPGTRVGLYTGDGEGSLTHVVSFLKVSTKHTKALGWTSVVRVVSVCAVAVK